MVLVETVPGVGTPSSTLTVIVVKVVGVRVVTSAIGVGSTPERGDSSSRFLKRFLTLLFGAPEATGGTTMGGTEGIAAGITLLALLFTETGAFQFTAGAEDTTAFGAGVDRTETIAGATLFTGLYDAGRFQSAAGAEDHAEFGGGVDRMETTTGAMLFTRLDEAGGFQFAAGTEDQTEFGAGVDRMETTTGATLLTRLDEAGRFQIDTGAEE